MINRRGFTFAGIFFAGAAFSLCISLMLLGADADAIRDGVTARIESRVEIPFMRDAIVAALDGDGAIRDELRSRQDRNVVLAVGAAAAVACGIAIATSRRPEEQA